MNGATPIIELRRYTLHPGQRDVLIELFEEQFVESQEELGMRLLGQFRDLDDPNSFVWLRGFADMPSRERGLSAFYGGPVWARYRERANATMVDSDNVLLLRRPSAQAALRVSARDRAAEALATGVVAAVIIPVSDADDALGSFEREAAVAALGGGGRLLGYLVTETSANNFPRLPIREGVNVLVFLVGYADRAGLDAARHVLEDAARVVTERGATPELLRLEPTPRSLLGGSGAECDFGAGIRRSPSGMRYVVDSSWLGDVAPPNRPLLMFDGG